METNRPVLNAFAADKRFRAENPEEAKRRDAEFKYRKNEIHRQRLAKPQKPMRKTKEYINPFKLSRTIIYERK